LRAALTRAENVIKGLRQQLAAERQKARRSYPIDEAFDDHIAKLVAAGLKGKKRCKLTDDRVDGMSKMFVAGYTLEDFQHVNTGLAHFQFVVYGKRRQHRAGRIPHIRMGRYVRFDPDELAAWCKARQRGPVQRTKETA
jgi:hypothetical protein